MRQANTSTSSQDVSTSSKVTPALSERMASLEKKLAAACSTPALTLEELLKKVDALIALNKEPAPGMGDALLSLHACLLPTPSMSKIAVKNEEEPNKKHNPPPSGRSPGMALLRPVGHSLELGSVCWTLCTTAVKIYLSKLTSLA